MNTTVVGFGSNINPTENITKAHELISTKYKIIATTTLVKTKPIGIQNQPDFINGAFLIETIFEIEELKSSLKDIESHLGRKQTADKFGPRTIDLDVLVWNNTVVNKDVYERAFIQASITELIPDFKI